MSVRLDKLPEIEEIAAWIDPLAFDPSSWAMTMKRRRGAVEIAVLIRRKLEELTERQE